MRRGLLAAVLVAAMAGAWGGPLDPPHHPLATLFPTLIRRYETSAAGRVFQRTEVRYGIVSTNADWQSYLAELPRVVPARMKTAPTDDRLAFLLNLHNSAVIAGISQRYPLPGGPSEAIARNRPWLLTSKVAVAGQQWTVGQIQEEIRNVREPLALFGLTDGAVESPPLPPSPFVGLDIRGQLEANGRAWIENPIVFKLDRYSKTLQITEWFRPHLDWLREVLPATPAALASYPDQQRSLVALIYSLLPPASQEFVRVNTPKVQWIPVTNQLNDAR